MFVCTHICLYIQYLCTNTAIHSYALENVYYILKITSKYLDVCKFKFFCFCLDTQNFKVGERVCNNTEILL